MGWLARSAASAGKVPGSGEGKPARGVRALPLYGVWLLLSFVVVTAYQAVIVQVVDRAALWRAGPGIGSLLLNAVILMAFGAIIYALVGRWLAAQALAVGATTFVVLAHLGKMLTLGNPLSLTDLGSFRQVWTLMPVLTDSLTPLLAATGLLLVMTSWGTVLGLRHPVRRAGLAERLVVGVAACLVLLPAASWTRLVPANSRLDKVLREDLADDRAFYANRGLLLAALLQHSLLPGAPDDYGRALVEEALVRNGLRPADATTPPAEPPDLVLYLGEAFWDPTLLAVTFDQDPIPNLRRLLAGPVAGQIRVPVYGGATPQTEFEILTGLPTTFFPSGTVVFQKYLHRPLPSLPAYLRRLGYHTTTVHTYLPWFWERQRVHPLLGFDRFVSMDDFPDPVMAGTFISDEVLVERIVTECGKASPCFVFGISMETHGPYQAVPDEKLAVRVTGGIDGPSRTLLERYASRLQRADRALGSLIERFTHWPRPVVVAAFGDHLPLLGNDYAVYRQTSFSTESFWAGTHTTPAVIWANFPLTPQRLDCRATALGARLLQAAGLPLPVPLALAARIEEAAPLPGVIPTQLARDRALLTYDLVMGDQHAGELDPLFGPGWQKRGDAVPAHLLGAPRKAGPEIVDYGPRQLAVGETHLVQPDGSSVMWVKTRGASGQVTLSLDNEDLPTTHGAQGLLTAGIPPEVLQRPGTYHLRLRDPLQHAVSAPVTIVVTSRPPTVPRAAAPATPLPARLVAWGPTTVTAGTPFNQQPSGNSAFWFRLEHPPASVQVVIDGQNVSTTMGTGGLVSASVPLPFGHPGTHTIVLRDRQDGRQLAKVTVSVRPASPAAAGKPAPPGPGK